MKRYQLSKYFKFTIVLAATSILLLMLYFGELLRYYFPLEVNEFNLSLLKNDQYARITSSECVPAPNVKGNATDQVFLGLFTEYPIYRLRIGKQGTLDVGICDKELISTIASWPDGKGDQSITVIARVSADDGKYFLLQTTKEEMRQRYGILSFSSGILTCITLMFFLTIGGVKVVYEKPFEDSKRYKDVFYGRTYHLEEELEHERKTLEQYRKEQLRIKKDFKIGIWISLGALMGWILCIMIMMLGSATSVAVGLLSGLSVILSVVCFYALLWGLKFVWNAYLNSDAPSAHKISEMFLLRTISVRREESAKLINLLMRKINEKNENQKEKETQKILMGMEGVDGKEGERDEGNVTQ